MSKQLHIGNSAENVKRSCVQLALTLILTGSETWSSASAAPMPLLVQMSPSADLCTDTTAKGYAHSTAAMVITIPMPQQTGIYYLTAAGDLAELPPSIATIVDLEPSLSMSTRRVLRLTGLSASIQFEQAPTFYVRLDTNLACDSGALATPGAPRITSPVDLHLLQLDPKTDRREVETAVLNCFTNRASTKNRIRPFDIEQVEPSLFKVTPNALAAGEYCFAYPAATPSGITHHKVFGFGIQPRVRSNSER